MARVTKSDIIKFKAFLEAILRSDPTGEFEIWDYDPFCERAIDEEWDGVDEDENPPKWVRKGEHKAFPKAKVVDELLKLAGDGKVKEMPNGRFYVVR